MRFAISISATRSAPQAQIADTAAAAKSRVSEAVTRADSVDADRPADTGLMGGLTSEQRLALLREALEEGKAEDVVVIDLDGKSSMADYMVVASGRSSRHVVSICEKVIEFMREATGHKPRAEGIENGDWVLIDASDIVAHVFRPEVREFYALEKMWAPSSPKPSSPKPSSPAKPAAETPQA